MTMLRTEYHARFLAKLQEARGEYMKKGILEIRIEDDLMKLYETLVQQRSQRHSVRYSITMLRELMNTRFVSLHIWSPAAPGATRCAYSSS